MLPEERAREFRSLNDISIATNMKVIEEPTLEENTFIYAVNDVAQRGIDIGQGNARVKQILDESKTKKAAVTIVAVQPTVMADRESDEPPSRLSRSGGNYSKLANGGWGILF